MKTINHLIISAVVLALTLCACGNSGEESKSGTAGVAQDSLLFAENDMLQDSLVKAQDYATMLSQIVNDVNQGLNEIKEMERIVSVSNFADETPEKRTKLRNDIMLIKNSIQERLTQLQNLENQLRAANDEKALSEQSKQQMLQTIASLREQLATQQTMINQLTEKLEAANTQIKNLSITVDSLNTVNTTARAETQKAQEETARAREEVTQLSDELNECFYALGTKKELKNHKIIETGFLKKTKVMQSNNIMHSYFTKADKRTLNEINLHSKKAKILTNHDSQSFTIEDDGTGNKVLKIHNQELFWQYSNYLVVQLD